MCISAAAVQKSPDGSSEGGALFQPSHLQPGLAVRDRIILLSCHWAWHGGYKYAVDQQPEYLFLLNQDTYISSYLISLYSIPRSSLSVISRWREYLPCSSSAHRLLTCFHGANPWLSHESSSQWYRSSLDLAYYQHLQLRGRLHSHQQFQILLWQPELPRGHSRKPPCSRFWFLLTDILSYSLSLKSYRSHSLHF